MRFKQPNDQQCAKQLSIYSPLLSAVEYEEVTFDGSFRGSNRFKGLPSPEIDAAWKNITNLKIFKVDVQNASSMRKNITTLVEATDSEGEWFTGNLEVFHQLHCVDFVGQYTYQDYNNSSEHKSPWLSENAEVVRVHIDHCLDILRQAIQCYGDTTVITFDWMKNRSTPYPNFYTRHKCRKLGPLSNWVTEHLEGNGEEWLEKPDGVPEIEHEHGH